MIVIDRSVGSLSLDLGIGIAMLEGLRDILAFNEEIEQLCQMRNKSCSYHHILRCSGRILSGPEASTSDVAMSANRKLSKSGNVSTFGCCCGKTGCSSPDAHPLCMLS